MGPTTAMTALLLPLVVVKWATATTATTWVACRARPGLTGAQVSTAGFDTRTCLPAHVPGTAFTNLLEAGAFKFADPFYADDLYAAPDIVNATPGFYSFFWRAELSPFAYVADADTADGTRADDATLTWLRESYRLRQACR